MIDLRCRRLLPGALALWASAAFPATPTTAEVSAALGGLAVRSILAVPEVPGYLQIVGADGSLFYVDEGLRYAIQGPLVDLRTRRNLSEEGRLQGKAVDFEAIPMELAIKRVKGNGSRRLAIVADPDCPFCVTLEETLRGVDDVTIYVLLHPLTELHPDAVAHSHAIWCDPDRGGAWERWMTERRSPSPQTNCSAPLEALAAFARTADVTATPMMIFPSGRVVYGAVAATAIEYYLDEESAQVADSARR